MSGLIKSGVVLAGYAVAWFVASAALAVRVANTSGPDAQASAGMYAFGDAILFIAVFGVVGLIPTGLALLFLRPYRWFWTLLSIAALAVAATGVAATLIYVMASHWAVHGSPLELAAALAVLRMLPAPLLATSLVLAAIVAPNRGSRWALGVATGFEGAVATYAILHWFIGCCFI
jgi:hypothetical protein